MLTFSFLYRTESYTQLDAAFVPNFLVPVILFESSVEIFENVRAVALSVIGILCQVLFLLESFKSAFDSCTWKIIGLCNCFTWTNFPWKTITYREVVIGFPRKGRSYAKPSCAVRIDS